MPSGATPDQPLATGRGGAAPIPVSDRYRRVSEAVDAWRAHLLELGGESALADIDQLGSASIDLTSAHPSGIAQLFSGRPTTLSNLVREGTSLAVARRRARTVLARADELAQRYGVAPTYLAIGIATWTVPAPAGPPDGAHAEAPAAEPPAPGGTPDGETPVALAPPPPRADAESPTGMPDVADLSAMDSGAAASSTAAGPGVPAADHGFLPPVQPSAAARVIRAPVLLRPVRLSARAESDVAVVLESGAEVNPVLVRALRAAGRPADAAALARATLTTRGFAPRKVLERLRATGEAVLPDFTLADHIVLGPFVHPGQVLIEDLDERRAELAEHDVVAALVGDPDAVGAVKRALPAIVQEDRSPDVERGVGDLDPSQQHAIDAVASGAHVFVDAPPGADAAATVAALLADAAASGRHTLYVPGTRRAGQGVTDVLQAAGLGDLLLDLSANSRWSIENGARLAGGAGLVPPVVDEAALRRNRAELVDMRSRLAAYITALHEPREEWGVSAYDALQHLAALTSSRVSPRTTVRMAPATVRALHGEAREQVRADLRRAADLGAFTIGPADTPWYGASLTDDASAAEAAHRADRLSQRALPEIRRRIADTAAQTGLERAETLSAWGEQLAMLDGVRDALDDFLPLVFERSPADMVAATATRQWRAERGIQMRWRTRRRLRRQARDLVRPGRVVSDLHRALVHVQEQREIWRRHCLAGGWPRLPDGLAQIEAEYRSVAADVRSLESVLVTTPEGGRLAERPVLDLEARLARLAADRSDLQSLPERTRLLDGLVRSGLRDLLTDLAERAVPADLVDAELELAWWSSVFEELLRADPALAGHDGETLGALADHFRELDLAQVQSLPGPVLRAVAARVARLLQADPTVAPVLADLAEGRAADVRDAVERLGPLAGSLRPCWLVAPAQIPQLLAPGARVDLVVIDAAQHIPLEQAISAISRARQVVLVGDSRRAALHAPGGPRGIVDALADVLPRVTLNADRVVREPALMAFLGDHGYADVIRSVPTPERRSALRLEVVDGFGMPVPGSDVVESVQAEVDRVVDLVIEHVLTRPAESLVVLTLSLRHADRVREAVRTAVTDSPAVRDFFFGDRSEPFVVLELDSAAGVRRDAVILSLGLGKTPHGRVMHRFGRVGDPDGAGLLIDAIDACRQRLTVVSCFRAGELDRRRLRTPGSLLLADLLAAAEAGGAAPATIPEEGEPDQLLVDLAERLYQLGLTVVPRYGIPGGVRIPLVISHPALPDEHLLAVLTDDAEYVREPCLRIRDRHDVQRLVDRGWRVHMAFSTAVFLDPQAEARQILATVLAALDERRARQAEYDAARPAPLAPPNDLAEVEADVEGRGESGADVDGGDEGPADVTATTTAPPRPDLPSGLPITSYSADDLDALASWLVATTQDASPESLDAGLRAELGVTRRGAQVDAVLAAVIARVAP